jgi:hypothetical protein
MTTKDDGVLRGFTSGATRDTGEGKLAFHGFLSPSVIHQYARYMNMNRLQSDGKLRDSDNWQKGIPMPVYVESEWRHHFDFWSEAMAYLKDQGFDRRELMAAACGALFNIMGFIHEWLKENPEVRFDDDEPTDEMRERQLKVEKAKEDSHPMDLPPVINSYTQREKILFPNGETAEFLNMFDMKDDSQIGVDLHVEMEEELEPQIETFDTVEVGESCMTCRFDKVETECPPCRDCIQKERMIGEAYTLWMENRDTTL